MKVSRYNINIKKNNGEFCVYNSFSGALAKVEEDFLNIIKEVEDDKNLDFNSSNEKYNLIEKMKKAGFLIDSEFDELRYINYLSDVQKYKSNKLKIVIAPTLQCNFGCNYCYEKPKNGFMNQVVQSDILDVIEKKINQEKIKELSVVWYGGEPLLCKNIINEMSEKIIEICANQKVTYFASIITNGYLIDENTKIDFKKNKIHSAQITLDGTPEIHNKRRYIIGKKDRDTFEKIVENINMLSDEINISIRMNVDKENSGNIKEFVELLNDKIKIKKNINIYLGHVFENYEEIQTDKHKCNTCLSKQEYSAIKYDFLKNSDKNEFDKIRKNTYPKLKLNYCAAVLYNSYVFDPFGNVFKCWNDICEEKNRVATIVEMKEKKEIEKSFVFSKWHLHNVFNVDKCKKCNVLPICAGGCPREQVMEKTEPKCEEYKYIIDDLIKYYSENFISEERR